jgi:molecular chaperone IbpA
MSRTLTLRSLDIPSIHRFGIGFDGMLDELMRLTDVQGQSNYPVYNIVKVSENDFYIDVAIAGFGEGDVKIELDNRILTISGSKLAIDEPIEYLHKGISDRSFVREFTLAEHVEVSGAMMKNGILSVSLKRTLPEKNAPKTIDIIYNK